MRESLEKEGYFDAESVLFLLGVAYQDLHPEMLDYLSNFPNADRLSQLFCEFKNGKYQLKAGVLHSSLNELIIKLHERHVTSRGHINNPLKFSIKLNSENARNHWTLLQMQVKIDIDKFADTIADYYEKSQYPSTFEKLLSDSGLSMAYESSVRD